MAQTVIQAFQVKRRLFRTIVLLIVILAAVLAGSWFLYKKLQESKAGLYDEIIYGAASKYCVDPCLLKAVIWKESAFDRNAAGGKGEIGLMQIKPDGAVTDWANSHGVPMLSRGVFSDPALNIEIGAWYLSKELRKWSSYKDVERLALCGYNAGPGNAEKWKPASVDADFKNNIKFRSTRIYVDAIIKKCEEYRKKRKEPR